MAVNAEKVEDVVDKTITGSCVCGAITYEAHALRPLWYCHCEQCRRMTGHFMAAAQTDLKNIKISGEPKWHYVSQVSRYGFCPDCGSQMFWRNDSNQYLSVTGGSMDDASSIEVKGHIFTAEQGKYYQLPQGEVKYLKWCGDGEI